MKARHAAKQALNIHLNVFPCLSDRNPRIGPPAAPPISNRVENNPAVNGEYPRDSLR